MWQARWLPAVLWPVGIAAVAWGFALLLRGGGEITALVVLGRSVGGSFIACGLIVWQRRPETRTGALMTLSGFLFLVPALLAEIGWQMAFTLGELLASVWVIPFAALVLSFPSGRLAGRADRPIVWGFVFGAGVLQTVWVALPPGRAWRTPSTPGSGRSTGRWGRRWPSSASRAGRARRRRRGASCCRRSPAAWPP